MQEQKNKFTTIICKYASITISFNLDNMWRKSVYTMQLNWKNKVGSLMVKWMFTPENFYPKFFVIEYFSYLI